MESISVIVIGRQWIIMNKIIRHIIVVLAICMLTSIAYATEQDTRLHQTATPYVKYFLDRALDNTTEFEGLTRSFQIDLGGHSLIEQAFINYGASSYDQTILGRVSLAGGSTIILDTYIHYFNRLSNVNNPLLNCNGLYHDDNGEDVLYGPYRLVRILGRSIPYWWEDKPSEGRGWDWGVDTGAAACLILYACEAYQKSDPHNEDYKNFAILLAKDYIIDKIQDADGGVRMGPRDMYHSHVPDYYWKTKSTEQNERVAYAFDALYEITGDNLYNEKAAAIRVWLKSMYDSSVHLFHQAAHFDGSVWNKTSFTAEVATDVMAFAPLDMMFDDTFFGATQAQRDAEVDDMFAAIEARTAFLDANNNPIFWKFSIGYTGDYGSVEFSSQMALAYLKVAQIYHARADATKTQEYLNKYNVLVASLETFFLSPASDADAKVAPYASYLDGSVAGKVETGTGYKTYNCQAALASCYYAFAKAGYLPYILGGGDGIPQTSYTLNMTDVPWYENIAPHNSTGAATAQMILDYIRQGAGVSLLTQQDVYEYAKGIDPFGSDLTPDQVDRALGHFDPYDTLISNWSDGYDSEEDGNPYKGYNFTVDTYDPLSSADAFNEYMRDICHWMDYEVTQEDWWLGGTLAACPNTPAAVPIYGTYDHWVAVKGYAASEDPCPEPHTNPWNTPDFTVYGFWIKDPLVTGIGKDTYKTAAECESTYFLPLATGDNYDGMFLQVAEPPLVPAVSAAKFKRPTKDIANLTFAGIEVDNASIAPKNRLSRQSYALMSEVSPAVISKKDDWKDIIDQNLLSDPDVVSAFEGKQMGKPLLVKRVDRDGEDYYLVPFGKKNRRGRRLRASGVIILDADQGYFKEASWTETPERFLKVDSKRARNIIRRLIIKDFYRNIRMIRRKLRRKYRNYRTFRRAYWSYIRKLYPKYIKLLRLVYKADYQLSWQPSTYSQSPYKPYWRVDANGYVWYVNQEGEIFKETELAKILNEIEKNRILMLTRYRRR